MTEGHELVNWLLFPTSSTTTTHFTQHPLLRLHLPSSTQLRLYLFQFQTTIF